MSHQINESYLGNPNVKRDGVQEQWTEEKVLEYKKCMEDPVYFSEKYLKVIHLDRGLVPFKLYPYQEKMFDHFNRNRFSIVLACRQSGKSISSVAYLLWFALFNPEKTLNSRYVCQPPIPGRVRFCRERSRVLHFHLPGRVIW